MTLSFSTFSAVFLLLSLKISIHEAQPDFNNRIPPNLNNPNQPGGQPLRRDDNSNNPYSSLLSSQTNLVPHGHQFGDVEITSMTWMDGKTIPLQRFFPYYGGRYNYTFISPNGYIGFAIFTDRSHTIKVGPGETDWPREADPAVIAPYLCKQRISGANGIQGRIFYRMETRSAAFSTGNFMPQFGQRRHCATREEYIYCDSVSDAFLDDMQRKLQDGVAGGGMFRADSALVVTWHEMVPNIGSESSRATYQLVWMTDAAGSLAYTMINYHKLNFNAADMQGNDRSGRCKAVFNGGNHTGMVDVDLSTATKENPRSLADRSSVPHVVRGRYFHRVDDVVRPAGCSNKTGGTFPLLIYPNIVNMLGQTKVDINGMCLQRGTSYVLMIDQRQTAPCEILNPSVARCSLPRIQDWGTKTVFFQPQSGVPTGEKAMVGYIYFVPPTLDPMRLDIGDIAQWFRNPVKDDRTVTWYPRNFTNPNWNNINNDLLNDNPGRYSMQLGLYIIGYKEARDDRARKFVPVHRVLARLATYSNRGGDLYRWDQVTERIDINRVEQWFITEQERYDDLYTFRFGYLKLAPTIGDDQRVDLDQIAGLVSSPIPLHWLWTVDNDVGLRDIESKKEYVKKRSAEMCHDWFAEDGAQANLIRDTETNASCPCVKSQAMMDHGRFMPHPRCSQLFRDVTCTETLGSSDCFMSAQNVIGSSESVIKNSESMHETHYGQVCCYDGDGYLMQTSYQPVIKIDDSTPYSPGFPMRAYEFGTTPFQAQYQVPGLSAFHHDMLPYYLCCKFADFRCQMFYWRRPSSSCQVYQPPAIGTVMSAGIFTTLDNQKFVFNDPGVYNLLTVEGPTGMPTIRIQVRMERFPDRSVDFSDNHLDQPHLVQPSNVTVVTGIALDYGDNDRVHVVLRKDTRRARYRTSILVGGVLRYFDHMQLQRFRGVTIYTNKVNVGQSEIYVVLDKAQIGVRIRESFADDMDRQSTYFESYGMLDLQLSVPPHYGIRPNGDRPPTREEMQDANNRRNHKVFGLLRPDPELSINPSLTPYIDWNAVNDPGRWNFLRQTYLIRQESVVQYGLNNPQSAIRVSSENLFEKRTGTAFEVLADFDLVQPTYKIASNYVGTQYSFVPQNQESINYFLNWCTNQNYGADFNDDFWQQQAKRCPSADHPVAVDCGDDVPCLFSALLLQSRVVGKHTKENLNTYIIDRYEATKKYNSCGAINLEYPEYLIKGPSSAGPAYLDGHSVEFSCFQDHVSYGHLEFKCERRDGYAGYDYNTYDVNNANYDYGYQRFEWNKGSQPWCRSRVKDNLFVWLQWMAIVVGILIFLILIFACCWSMKRRRMERNRIARNGSDYHIINRSGPPPPLIRSEKTNELVPLSAAPKERLFSKNSNIKTATTSSSPSHSLDRTNSPGFTNMDRPPTAIRSNSQPFLNQQFNDWDAPPKTRFPVSHSAMSTPQSQRLHPKGSKAEITV